MRTLLTQLGDLLPAAFHAEERLYAHTVGVLVAVFALAVLVKSVSRKHSLRSLIIAGAVLTILLVGFLLKDVGPNDTKDAQLWPVLLGCAAFLYTWWLAGLLLDLTFTWHQYIRSELLNEKLLKWFEEGVAGEGEANRPEEPPPPEQPARR